MAVSARAVTATTQIVNITVSVIMTESEIQHLRRRLAEAATLLEALANCEMPYNDVTCDRECLWCNLAQHSEYEMSVRPNDHDKDCPIRLASEWLQV